MKVTLAAGIASMSGKNGNMVFRTYKRPNGKIETRAYVLPKKGWDARQKRTTYGYTRTTKPSEKEIAARERFSQISQILNNLTEEQRTRYAQEWQISKYKFNGKSYATLRGYIMARIYAEQESQTL